MQHMSALHMKKYNWIPPCIIEVVCEQLLSADEMHVKHRYTIKEKNACNVVLQKYRINLAFVTR